LSENLFTKFNFLFPYRLAKGWCHDFPRAVAGIPALSIVRGQYFSRVALAGSMITRAFQSRPVILFSALWTSRSRAADDNFSAICI